MSTDKKPDYRPTICLDHDGVGNDYAGHFDAADLGKINPELKPFVLELRRRGFDVVVLSTREPESLKAWYHDNGVPVDDVTNIKVPAVAYIDDRGITFKGSFLEVLSQLETFEPWWKAKES
jgi:hypothetical protein